MTVEDGHKHQMVMAEDAEKGETRQQQDVRFAPGNITTDNPR
jgi:hypothetical protein